MENFLVEKGKFKQWQVHNGKLAALKGGHIFLLERREIWNWKFPAWKKGNLNSGKFQKWKTYCSKKGEKFPTWMEENLKVEMSWVKKGEKGEVWKVENFLFEKKEIEIESCLKGAKILCLEKGKFKN